LQQKDKVLWIPLPALRTFQGKDFVLVVEGEVQRRVTVTVGIRSEDHVEVLSGLTAGQIVVGP
jgi:multidrug efflux pump subunit AcrA (membrane-fusion protein)